MTRPFFIRPMHPKTEIMPTPAAIKRLLETGWGAQIKMHGHRAQIHVPADSAEPIVCFNRQGNRHAKDLSLDMQKDLRRLFQPQEGWNVIDAEWLKDREELFIFDYLKFRNQLLMSYNFVERWELLPQVYASNCIRTLGLLQTVDKCLAVMESPDDAVEGLVFKSKTAKGFSDTSIVRCRKRGSRH